MNEGEGESESEDRKPLLKNDDNLESEEMEYSSKARQRGMLFTILCLQFLSLCADTSIYPCFPVIAKEKGLTTTQMGFVFSCYELSRFIFSPIFGSLVSML